MFSINRANVIPWLSVAVVSGGLGCAPNHPVPPVVEQLLESIVSWSERTGDYGLVQRVKTAYSRGELSRCVELLREATTDSDANKQLVALQLLLEEQIQLTQPGKEAE